MQMKAANWQPYTTLDDVILAGLNVEPFHFPEVTFSLGQKGFSILQHLSKTMVVISD